MSEDRPDISALFEDGSAIDEALRTAAREALDEHRKAGRPVAIWRDGKVVWVSAEEALAACDRQVIGPDAASP